VTDATEHRAADKKAMNYAVAYMHMTATRNAYIEILTNWFGGKDGPEVIRSVADELLAVDPKAEFKKMMEGDRA
jgi:hypothetical protein